MRRSNEKGGTPSSNGDIVILSLNLPEFSEPIPVAQTFTYIDEELGIDLTQKCSLDTMVTVVDANRFWEDFSSGKSLSTAKKEQMKTIQEK